MQITTFLDLVGLLLIAAGVGCGAALLVGWSALAVSGLVLIGGSQLSSWLGARDRPGAGA